MRSAPAPGPGRRARARRTPGRSCPMISGILDQIDQRLAELVLGAGGQDARAAPRPALFPSDIGQRVPCACAHAPVHLRADGASLGARARRTAAICCARRPSRQTAGSPSTWSCSRRRGRAPRHARQAHAHAPCQTRSQDQLRCRSRARRWWIPVALSSRPRQHAWLKQLDPEREAQQPRMCSTACCSRIASPARAPHIHEISPPRRWSCAPASARASTSPTGFGVSARELCSRAERAGKRASVLRPQERLALLLSARGSRAAVRGVRAACAAGPRQGSVALAAIELDRAYAAACASCRTSAPGPASERIEELQRAERRRGRRAPTRRFRLAREPEERVVRHALERLEAALRARTATGFGSSSS